MMKLKTSIIAACLLTLVACSDKGETPPTDQAASTPTTANRDFTVAQTFEVGPTVYVRSLDVDTGTNRLWVGTTIGALEVDLGSQDMVGHYNRDHGLANEYIFAVKVAADGSKWFGTNGGGISLLKGDKWNTYFPMHGLADYWIYSFVEDRKGQMWIGTWAGLNVMDQEKGTFRTYVKELVNEWVYGLDVDSKDNVWIGTEGGINMFDGENWKTWTHKDGLGAANLDQLPVSENTGLGTRDRHDLSVMMQGQATYNPNYVFSLQVDSKDRVWAGTWGGGASFYDGSKWTSYSERDGLAGNIVYSVAVDANDNVFLGTNKGVSYFDGKSWQTLTTNDGLADNNAYAIALTPKGDIWVGTRGGVSLIQRKVAR